jgi:hypothetical protein
VKEFFKLKATFLYGDFNAYLQSNARRYDLIFAAGVLYHMVDPLALLHLISQRTDRLFLWTLYVSEENAPASAIIETPTVAGYTCPYYRYDYEEEMHSRGYSGTDSFCSRLLRKDILGALHAYNFDQIRVVKEELDAPSGPNFSVVAYRSSSLLPPNAHTAG